MGPLERAPRTLAGNRPRHRFRAEVKPSPSGTEMRDSSLESRCDAPGQPEPAVGRGRGRTKTESRAHR
jgi:hypothetical protein